MTDDELTDRLRLAAHDGGRPLTTDVDALLGRAQRARRRRRAAGVAGLGVGAVAVAAAVVLPSLGGGSTLTGEPVAPGVGVTTAADPEPTDPPAPATLSAAEVVRRCEPQLAKYDELPMYGAPKHPEVIHPRDYHVGDVVLVGTKVEADPDDPGWPLTDSGVLCVVPEAGHEDDPVPFSRFEVDGDDEARILELCAETWTPYPGNGEWADLRDGEVLATDRSGKVATVLVGLGTERYACALSPQTWDVGLSGVDWASRGEVYLNGTTTGIKSLADDAAAYYYGAGVLEKGAATLRITLSDGQSFERPVGADGGWAMLVRVPGTGGLLQHTIDVLDADGDVIDSFRSDR